MSTALHSPERWKIIENLFHQCLEMSPESRAAFLAEHCGSDTELLKQIEALLESASKQFTVVEDRIMNAARDFVAAVRAARSSPESKLAITKSSPGWVRAAWERFTSPWTRASSGRSRLKF
jgi:hypothetical protein